jgi:hypothetical protein
METISNTVWQRRGSSIVFDQQSLGPFIRQGAVVSLRKAFSWMKALPSVPPVPGQTILISGLETIVETLSPDEAEDFLIRRIRPFIIELQNRWTDCGIIFGFSAHKKAFEETSFEEEIIFRRRDQKVVRLSEGLWDGSAAVNMKRIMRMDDKLGKEIVIGYYVARIS